MYSIRLSIKYLATMIMPFVACLITISFFINRNTTFTQEEQNAFLDEYSAYVSEGVEPSILARKLDLSVKRLSKDGVSKAVDGLLINIHQHTTDMEIKLEGLSFIIGDIMTDNFDINNPKNIKLIADDTARAFVKQIQDRYLLLVKYEKDIYIKVNYQGVLDKYGDYIHDDLRDLITSSIEEDMDIYYSSEKNMLNFDSEYNLQKN